MHWDLGTRMGFRSFFRERSNFPLKPLLNFDCSLKNDRNSILIPNVWPWQKELKRPLLFERAPIPPFWGVARDYLSHWLILGQYKSILHWLDHVKVAVSLLCSFDRPTDFKELDLLDFSMPIYKPKSRVFQFFGILKFDSWQSQMLVP